MGLAFGRNLNPIRGFIVDFDAFLGFLEGFLWLNCEHGAEPLLFGASGSSQGAAMVLLRVEGWFVEG